MIINAKKRDADRKKLLQGSDKTSIVNSAEDVQFTFGLWWELGNDC